MVFFGVYLVFLLHIYSNLVTIPHKNPEISMGIPMEIPMEIRQDPGSGITFRAETDASPVQRVTGVSTVSFRGVSQKWGATL